MRRYPLVFIFFVLVTGSSCTITPTRLVEDTRYSSDLPPLNIEFAHEIDSLDENGNQAIFTFVDKEQPAVLEYHLIQVLDNKIDYYYSLEHIALNSNYLFLGNTSFNGQQWARVASVSNNVFWTAGYLTRKEKWLIYLFTYYEMTDLEIERSLEYKKTTTLLDVDRDLIEGLFDELDGLILSVK